MELTAVVRDDILKKVKRFSLPVTLEYVASEFRFDIEDVAISILSIEELPTLNVERNLLYDLNELAKNLKDEDKDLVLSYIESQSPNVSDLLKFNFHDCSLYSDITTDHELGAYMVANNGFNLGLILKYLDYEKYGRDVRLEEGGSFTDRGYFLPKANRL